jgi:hypothetical protein
VKTYISPPRLLVAAMSVASLILSIAAIAGPGVAQASNGSCVLSEGWTCEWFGNNWPKDTKLWFEAPGGENERNWHADYGFDSAGGSVYKCSGFKSHDGGEIEQGCSNTGPSYVAVPANRDPGWVYMVQHANGPRNIHGTATS